MKFDLKISRLTLYLVSIGLFAFGLLPTEFLGDKSPDINLVCLMLLLIWGMAQYWNSKSPISNTAKAVVSIIFLLIIFSCVIPVYDYHQSLLSTLLAQRYSLTFLYFILFAKMKLTERKIEPAFRILSVLSLFSLILAIKYPYLYASSIRIEYLESQRQLGLTSDFAVTYPGIGAVFIYFCLFSRKVFFHPTQRNLIIFISIFLYILICQNRGHLIGAILIVVYVLLKAKYRYKSLILGFGTLIIIIVGSAIFSHLIEETQDQLSNPNYNRLQAISFFLIEFPQSAYSIIFGHGVPCVGSPYLRILLNAQEMRYAFITDIGLLGTFFYYGIAMVALFLYFDFKGMLGKGIPIWLRLYCLWMLLAIWLQGFAIEYNEIKYCLIFYFICYHSYLYHKKSIVKTNNHGCVNNNR